MKKDISQTKVGSPVDFSSFPPFSQTKLTIRFTKKMTFICCTKDFKLSYDVFKVNNEIVLPNLLQLEPLGFTQLCLETGVVCHY